MQGIYLRNNHNMNKNIKSMKTDKNRVIAMLMKAFEVAWTLVFLVVVILRYLSVVNFEIGYDEIALMCLAFGVGMIAREVVGN